MAKEFAKGFAKEPAKEAAKADPVLEVTPAPLTFLEADVHDALTSNEPTQSAFATRDLVTAAAPLTFVQPPEPTDALPPGMPVVVLTVAQLARLENQVPGVTDKLVALGVLDRGDAARLK